MRRRRRAASCIREEKERERDRARWMVSCLRRAGAHDRGRSVERSLEAPVLSPLARSVSWENHSRSRGGCGMENVHKGPCTYDVLKILGILDLRISSNQSVLFVCKN